MTDRILSQEDAAKTWLCPLARTFGTQPLSQYCRGAACAVWRSAPRPTDDAWRAAVKAVADQNREKPPFAKAARAVADDPEGHGLGPWDKGSCGLREP
ncbi:hypothetical protein JANAI61_05770 [Jannaschia sp. AI_61]|nr:hypothetical protein JANAI61_05770 [Jannaschia sp. AI_61]